MSTFSIPFQICSLGAIISSFLQQPFIATFFVFCLAILGAIYWFISKKDTKSILETDERKNIVTEFTKRFHTRLSDLAQMESIKSGLEKKKAELSFLSEEIKKDVEKERSLLASINGDLEKLTKTKIEQEKWISTIKKIEDYVVELEKRMTNDRSQLDKLNIEPSDFVDNDPGVGYRHEDEIRAAGELQVIEDQIKKEMEGKERLKISLMNLAGENQIIELDELVMALRKKREDIAGDYRMITAKIVAGIMVNKALNLLKQKEEEYLTEGINSKLIIDPLEFITGHYKEIYLEGDDIYVNDGLGSIPFKNLSTGAQEQVLLALRVGFAQRWFNKEKSFIILDDAFQNSDWERRERLVQVMIKLAQNGYQIFYFTMDNHIKSLFEKIVKPVFEDDFKLFELNNQD